MSTSTDDADAPATATPPPAPVESRMEGRTRTGAEEAPCTALLTASLERSRERFDRALNGVTVEQANTQPAPRTAPRVDSLSWLIWHTAREIDLQVSALTGTETLWTAGGFKERFALPLPDDTEDWHHTPEQAALVRVDDLTVLTDYLDAAYALIRGYLADRLARRRRGPRLGSTGDPRLPAGLDHRRRRPALRPGRLLPPPSRSGGLSTTGSRRCATAFLDKAPPRRRAHRTTRREDDRRWRCVMWTTWPTAVGRRSPR